MIGDPRAARLSAILQILRDDPLSAAMRIERLYRLLFEDSREVFPEEPWDPEKLDQALQAVEEIVVHYVQLFHEQRAVPVSYFKRQERVAAALDRQLSRVLRAHPDASPAPDPFLDGPIRLLSREARAKTFPRAKKGGGISLRAIRERYQLKLLPSWDSPRQDSA